MGYETKEVLVTTEVQCPFCKKGNIQEILPSYNGDKYDCQYCFNPLVKGLNDWKKTIYETLDWCDVAIFQRNTDKCHLDIMIEAKKRGKFVVTEADDSYFNVPTNNPGYKYYQDRLDYVRKMFQISDGVTVTTKKLREHYLGFNKNIAVIQNSFDIDIFEATPPLTNISVYTPGQQLISLDQFNQIRKDKKFVCWAGSPTHEKDLEIVIKPLKKLMDRENVVIGMAAYVHRAMLTMFPQDRFFLFGLVPVIHWNAMLKTLSPDVWIAPLEKNKFNEAKSNIKKIESVLMGSLFVGSDLDPYNDDEIDGFLPTNNEYDWWTNLRYAVNTGEEEKKEIITRNREVLLRDFDIKNVYKKWSKFFDTGVADEV